MSSQPAICNNCNFNFAVDDSNLDAMCECPSCHTSARAVELILMDGIPEIRELYLKAEATLRNGSFDEAMELYRQIIVRKPNCHEAWWGLYKCQSEKDARGGYRNQFGYYDDWIKAHCIEFSLKEYAEKAIEYAPQIYKQNYKSIIADEQKIVDEIYARGNKAGFMYNLNPQYESVPGNHYAAPSHGGISGSSKPASPYGGMSGSSKPASSFGAVFGDPNLNLQYESDAENRGPNPQYANAYTAPGNGGAVYRPNPGTGGGNVIKKRKLQLPEQIAVFMLFLCIIWFAVIPKDVEAYRSRNQDGEISFKEAVTNLAETAMDALDQNAYNITWGTLENLNEYYEDYYGYRKREIGRLVSEYGYQNLWCMGFVGFSMLVIVLFLIVSRVRRGTTRKSFVWMLILTLIGICVSIYLSVFCFVLSGGNVSPDYFGGVIHFNFNEQKQTSATVIVGLCLLASAIVSYIYTNKHYKWTKIVRE